jgi:hypothetical protein
MDHRRSFPAPEVRKATIVGSRLDSTVPQAGQTVQGNEATALLAPIKEFTGGAGPGRCVTAAGIVLYYKKLWNSRKESVERNPCDHYRSVLLNVPGQINAHL